MRDDAWHLVDHSLASGERGMARPTDSPVESRAWAANHRRILIIDDFDDSANLVKLILTRKCSDEVYIATSASQGLSMASQEKPDLIIVRIMMSEMNGYEVCCQLKAIPVLQSIPVLLQAAMDPKRVYSEAQRVGAAGYLYQPFSPQEVIAARDALLRGDVYYPPVPKNTDRPPVDHLTIPQGEKHVRICRKDSAG